MKQGDKFILFRIVINQKNGGFSHASNFITKLVNSEALSQEEVKGISSRMVYCSMASTKTQKAQIVVDNQNFLPITRPQNMIEGVEGQNYEIGLVIEDEYLEDAVSIQPYVLMRLFFENTKIFSVILGKESHLYVMNHLLSDILEEDIFSENIFYYLSDQDRLRVMHKSRRNVKLRAFYPIQIVNEELLLFLNSNLGEVLKQSNPWDNLLLTCLTGKEDISKQVPKQVRNVCFALQQNQDIFTRLNPKESAELFLKENTLTFILFIFLIQSRKRSKQVTSYFMDIKELKESYYQSAEYAHGILQLLENIVFHARAHSGVFSMRLYNADREDYLAKKFPETKEASYLEVLVADYQGSNHCDNIATHFVKNLSVQEQQIFKELTPWDLFAYGSIQEKVSSEVEAEFKKYYENLDNLGRHYGLKLFRNMVLKNKGAFHFYSCMSHQREAGEWGGVEIKQDEFECLPGTGYFILLPAISRKKKTFAAIMDNYNEYKNFGSHIGDYDTFICKSFVPDGNYQTQKQKDKLIQKYMDFFTGEFLQSKSGKHSIAYFSVRDFSEIQAEFIYKALMRMNLHSRIPDIVLYDSNKSFANAIRRNAEIFFEKVGLEEVYGDNQFCLALYAMDGEEEAIIYPASKENTFRANISAEYSQKKDWMISWDMTDHYAINGERYAKIPYDVLTLLPFDGAEKTIFEVYVQTILDQKIQEKEYGCKLENTHMRLGSTIHVSTFYEAELLFHNRYFITRFAFQIVQTIYRENSLMGCEHLTICS